MLFIITDWIHGKQYKTENEIEAEKMFQDCVERAKRNKIELTKIDWWYECDDWHKIMRNWNIPEKVKSKAERDRELYWSWICQLCGDAIKEDFGFCRKCKKIL